MRDESADSEACCALADVDDGGFMDEWRFDDGTANNPRRMFVSKEEVGIRMAVGARDGESLSDSMTMPGKP